MVEQNPSPSLTSMLYHDIHSPHSRAVLAFLRRSKINDVSIVNLDMEKGGHRKPEYEEKSGGSVPLFEEGNFHLTESSAILMYLAETKNKLDLYPSDITQMAKIEKYFEWAPSAFYAPVSILVYNELYGPTIGRQVNNQLTNEQKLKLIEALKLIENQVKQKNWYGTKFIAGSILTMADFAAACFIDQMQSLWEKIGIDLKKQYNNIYDWHLKMKKEDGYKQVHEEWIMLYQNKILQSQTVSQTSKSGPQAQSGQNPAQTQQATNPPAAVTSQKGPQQGQNVSVQQQQQANQQTQLPKGAVQPMGQQQNAQNIAQQQSNAQNASTQKK